MIQKRKTSSTNYSRLLLLRKKRFKQSKMAMEDMEDMEDMEL
jgi:hypothetical protein